MSVPLQSVPENQEETVDSSEDQEISQAKHEAAEIVARARRQAEAIVAEARSTETPASSPRAALGSNAEEIIGQVRKLIKKQRALQAERTEMVDEIEALKSERDELVQRLTDAVVRMEELAKLADGAQPASSTMISGSKPPSPPPPPPPISPANAPRSRPDFDQRTPAPEPAPADRPQEEDTSLAARLRQAELEEQGKPAEDSSLAARLEKAERARQERVEADIEALAHPVVEADEDAKMLVGADGRSFYDRHSAKLPRLEGDGGRSVLSAIGDMRPESEPKGRKGRRRTKK